MPWILIAKNAMISSPLTSTNSSECAAKSCARCASYVAISCARTVLAMPADYIFALMMWSSFIVRSPGLTFVTTRFPFFLSVHAILASSLFVM